MRKNLACVFLMVVAQTWSTGANALTQPDGSQVPSDTEVRDELALLGETIDPLTDAAVTPQTFRPQCTLTFTVLRRLTDYRNSFGWYNVTGRVPALDELYEFIHCDDPPETWQQGEQTSRVLDIRTDDRYLGGEIGFFQARATNPGPSGMSGGCADVTDAASVEFVVYSQPALNPENTADPFIHLLTMNSTVNQSVFYFAWEDLLSGGDNDFSDLIIRVEGVTCSGGGEPCETGQPGVCGAGLTQCDRGEITCQPRIPASNESCNALDDDCDGAVDNGELCATNEICDRGQCIARCSSGEFQCPSHMVCRDDGYCVDPACESVTCPDSEVCQGGSCSDPCQGVVCPHARECRAGRCVDPCAAISCGMNQACISGACLTTCECSGCPAGEFCDLAQKLCVETACDQVTCNQGSHCEAGACVDDCAGAVCPLGGECRLGECEEASLGGDASGVASSAGGGFSLPTIGASSGTTSSTSAGGASSATGVGPSASRQSARDDGGCGCRTARPGSRGDGLSLLLIGAAASGLLQRRRRLLAVCR